MPGYAWGAPRMMPVMTRDNKIRPCGMHMETASDICR
jgi:hypothetical protein